MNAGNSPLERLGMQTLQFHTTITRPDVGLLTLR